MKKVFLFMTFMMGCSLSSWAQTGGDSYLDIANYATIDDNYTPFTLSTGPYTLYKYAEYPDDGVAWLTMPVYLAYRIAGIRSNQNENWITLDPNPATTSHNNTSVSTLTWDKTPSATDPFWGSDAYFGSGKQISYGGNKSNTKKETISFFVTNVTQVRLWGNTHAVTSGYKATIRIFKCTKNGNSVSVSTLINGGQTEYTSNQYVHIDYISPELDPSQIYKVECSNYRCLFKEIAFRTPLDLGGYDVVISTAGLSTLYLDYPVSIPYDTYDPDLLGVFYIRGIGSDGKELLATRLNNIIPANTGVIVQGNSNTPEVPTYFFPRITDNQAASYAENSATSLLEGSTTEIPKSTVEGQNPGKIVYTLGRGKDSYINFYRYKGTTLAANKAYLLVTDTSNSAKSFTLNFDGDATGINTVDANDVDGAWYNLQGVQVQGQPTSKGVFIRNGKKVVVK